MTTATPDIMVEGCTWTDDLDDDLTLWVAAAKRWTSQTPRARGTFRRDGEHWTNVGPMDWVIARRVRVDSAMAYLNPHGGEPFAYGRIEPRAVKLRPGDVLLLPPGRIRIDAHLLP